MNAIPLSESQHWVIATGAILHTINSAHPDLIAGYPRPSGTASNTLEYWWKIRTTEEARDTLNNLRQSDQDIDDVQEAKSIIAWDYMRMSNVAGWSYGAGLLDKEEAWAIMLEAARVLQSTYGSWAELGIAYCHNHSAWANQVLDNENQSIEDGLLSEDKRSNAFLKVDDDSSKAIKKLLAEGGTWSQLPWDTSLNNVPAPVEPEVEIYPKNDKPLEETLNDIINQGIDPNRTRIRMLLEPGVYHAALEVKGALEIVGLGEGVVIETKDAAEMPVITMNNDDALPLAGLVLSNLEIRTGANKHDLDGINIRSGLLCMSNIYVNGGDWGVCLANSSAIGHLKNCTLANNNTGLWVDYGTAVCDAITVTKSRKHGIHVLEDGTLEMTSGHIYEHTSYGVSCSGRAMIQDTHIDQCKGSSFGLHKNGAATIINSRLTNSERFGVFVDEGAEGLLVSDTLIEGHKHAGVQAISLDYSAEFKNCLIRKNETGGANLYPGKNVGFYNCRFEQLRPAAIQILAQVNDWSDSALVDGCLFSECNGGAIDVCNGGKLQLNNSTIEKSTSFGILVRGESSELKAQNISVSSVEKAGINVHTGGHVEVVDCTIESSGHGILLQEGGKLKGKNINLSKNTGPLGLYGKNTEAELTNLVLNADKEKIIIRQNASCTIKDGRIDGGKGVYVIDSSKLYANSCEFMNCLDANIVAHSHSHVFLDNCHIADFSVEGLVACESGKINSRHCKIKPSDSAIALFAFDDGEIQFQTGTFTPGNYKLIQTQKLDDTKSAPGKIALFEFNMNGVHEDVQACIVSEMENFDYLLAQHFDILSEQ